MKKKWPKAFMPKIEIKIASICFVALFLALLFRIGNGVVSSILIAIQNSTQTDIGFIESATKWISKNSQWTGEGAQWLWVWLVMLGLSEAERTQSNLTVSFFLEKMPLATQKVVKIILDSIYLVSVIFLFVLSFQELARSKGSLPSTLPFSNMWLYLSLTVGFVFLTIRIATRIINTVKLAPEDLVLLEEKGDE